MHVAVAGNIGSGKTTLTSLLAKNFKWEPHYEDVDDNPYLNDFYEDMPRWSFNLQIYFLKNRFTQVAKLIESNKKVIQDRTIYEDAYIFAPNLHAMGLMTTRDYKNYLDLFQLMEAFIKPPDLKRNVAGKEKRTKPCTGFSALKRTSAFRRSSLWNKKAWRPEEDGDTRQ